MVEKEETIYVMNPIEKDTSAATPIFLNNSIVVCSRGPVPPIEIGKLAASEMIGTKIM